MNWNVKTQLSPNTGVSWGFQHAVTPLLYSFFRPDAAQRLFQEPPVVSQFLTVISNFQPKTIPYQTYQP
jgi:hypothetical protein